MVGKAGQKPVQKKLKSGTVVTLLSLGTGGIRNNRRPLDHENPNDYANRCAVQWHRVSVYPERLGNLLMKNVVPGLVALFFSSNLHNSICKFSDNLFSLIVDCSSTLYVEGNLETKVFSDPITGLVRRIREVAVRRHGSNSSTPPILAEILLKYKI